MSLDYLRIETFLEDALTARLLQAAFDSGLIDALANGDEQTVQLAEQLPVDPAGLRFLLQSLEAANVLRSSGETVRLTDAFQACLAFRDLLTTKLKFCQLLARDYFEHLPELLTSERDFMSVAKLFELFDYSRCTEVTTQNCMHASRWMQLTTMLSRYEGPVCCEHFDFARHRSLLDIGGNSGEFSSQIVRRTPDLNATVMDLPVVCAVGQRHLDASDVAKRVSFIPGDMRHQDFPVGHDLISWKSVLHDWPDNDSEALIRKTWDALPAGGRILIFERQQCDFRIDRPTYGLLPIQLFFRSYRKPSTYVDWLTNAGFADIKLQELQLDVPWLLLAAVKA